MTVTITRRDLLVGCLATALLAWVLVLVSIQVGRDQAMRAGGAFIPGCLQVEPYRYDGPQVILRGNIVHGYPGGWHWRVECGDGQVFHIQVPQP